MRALLFIATLALANPALSATAPAWTTLADCSAAYEVNAAIKDPTRSPTMAGDMAAVAADYHKAAVRSLSLAKPIIQAESAVTSRIVDTKPRFAGMTRTRLDQVINACPQIG